MLLQHLQLNNINIADDSYRITFSPELESLKRSLRMAGLVQPIILRHTPEGTYQIVTGYKRVLILQELNRQSVPALVAEASDLSPAQAFLMNLHDNGTGRKLNLIEQSNAIRKLAQFCSLPEEDLVQHYLPLIGAEASYKILHQLQSLHALTEPMKNHLVQNDFSLSSAARIAEFTPSTQQALLGVLAHIRPTTGKLNELLSLIREISARDGISVESVLERYQLLTIVANPAATPADKVKALRQTLRGVRLPQLTARQQELAKLIQGLELPDSAKLIADPYFENQKFKLEYQFTQPEDLDVLINRIKSAFQKQQWKSLLEWYRA